MELRQLKYFLAVADARSFVSAANSLYLSRQAVSKAISQLEAELETELFMRDSNGAFLTPAGIMFYERVRGTVLELEQLGSEMRQFGAQFHQVIRIAFSVGTLGLYEGALQEFIRRQKNVVAEYVECTPEEGPGLLTEHRADLVVSTRMEDAPQFVTRCLCQSPYGVLLREQEQLGELESVSPRDLLWLPLACPADGRTPGICAENGLTPQYQGIDLLRLLNLAAQGRCAVILPQCLLPAAMPGLRWIRLDISQTWQVYQVALKSMESNALYQAALDELLLQVFQQLP